MTFGGVEAVEYCELIFALRVHPELHQNGHKSGLPLYRLVMHLGAQQLQQISAAPVFVLLRMLFE